MRDYSAVCPQFWTGRTGRQIRKLGPMAQVVALYLLTAPGSTMLGLYYLPIGTIVHETGVPEGDVNEIMADFDEMGFAHYDADNEVVWVVEMARFQIAEELKTNDNRYKYVVKESPRFAASPLYDRWYDQYHVAFNLPARKVKAKPLQGPLKGVADDREPPFGEGSTPPVKQRQDQDKTGSGQDNPRASTPTTAREAPPAPEVVIAKSTSNGAVPSGLALVARIADASGGKFDTLGGGTAMHRALAALLIEGGVTDEIADCMAALVQRPDRLWPKATNRSASGITEIGWVMGKVDADGAFKATWLPTWIRAAKDSLAAEAKRRETPRITAPPTPPVKVATPEEFAAVRPTFRGQVSAHE